jgi:hypothetical protein
LQAVPNWSTVAERTNNENKKTTELRIGAEVYASLGDASEMESLMGTHGINANTIVKMPWDVHANHPMIVPLRRLGDPLPFIIMNRGFEIDAVTGLFVSNTGEPPPPSRLPGLS